MRSFVPLFLWIGLSESSASRPAEGPSPFDLAEPLRTGQVNAGDWGLVVGIEDYAFIPDVPYATRDADAFRDTLVYARGVPVDHVVSLTGPVSREKIVEAATRIGREAKPGATVWVYYAGHGAASPVDGQRILLGVDTQADPTTFAPRAVAVDELERLVAAGGARAFLVADTCYTGTGRGGTEIVTGKRFAVPSYTAHAGPLVQEWVAASPGETSGALDDEEHGAFTYLTLVAMRGAADGELSGTPDGTVTVREVQAYVTRELRARQILDQTPQLVGDGDWPLVAGVPAPPPASAPPPTRPPAPRPTPTPTTPRPSSAPPTMALGDTNGFAMGVGLGLPTAVRVGWEFGQGHVLSAAGARAGVGPALYLSSPTLSQAQLSVPLLAYVDLRVAERLDVEVSAGDGGGLAVQYDPPSPFQLQLGALITLSAYSWASPVLGPDLAVEWVW